MKKLVFYGHFMHEYSGFFWGSTFFDTYEEATSFKEGKRSKHGRVVEISILDYFDGKTNVIMVRDKGEETYFHLENLGYCFYVKDESKWVEHNNHICGMHQDIYRFCRDRGINILNDSTQKLLMYKGDIYKWSSETEAYLEKQAMKEPHNKKAYVVAVEYFPEQNGISDVLGVSLCVYPVYPTFYCRGNNFINMVHSSGAIYPFFGKLLYGPGKILDCYKVLTGEKRCLHINNGICTEEFLVPVIRVKPKGNGVVSLPKGKRRLPPWHKPSPQKNGS